MPCSLLPGPACLPAGSAFWKCGSGFDSLLRIGGRRWSRFTLPRLSGPARRDGRSDSGGSMRHLRFDEDSAVTLINSVLWIKSRTMCPGYPKWLGRRQKILPFCLPCQNGRMLRMLKSRIVCSQDRPTESSSAVFRRGTGTERQARVPSRCPPTTSVGASHYF